jgi:hypothetical protein
MRRMAHKCFVIGLSLLLAGMLCSPPAALSAKTKKRGHKRPPAASQNQEKSQTPEETPVEPKSEQKAEPSLAQQPDQTSPPMAALIGPEDKRTDPEAKQRSTVMPEKPVPQEKETTDEDRAKEAEEAQRLTELFLRNQSVFIHKGELMVELNTFYNRSSRDDFQSISGGAILVKNTTKFIDNSLILRYGLLTDGLELDLIVPFWIHAQTKQDFGVAQSEQSKDGFGDLAAALRYELWYERGNRPSVILDISGKSRTGGTGLTGTGTWNMGGGITLLKTIDPVVFFGRIGYVNNFASETRNLGNIFEYRLGMGFSLNDKVSFNMQLTGSNIQPSSIMGLDTSDVTGPITPTVLSVKRLELMNLLFTTTIIVNRRFSLEPVVGIPLTNESFAFIGIRVPYRF